MSERNGDWIQTYTHRKFWPLDPRADEVFIEDIAHALALQCRFTGHSREFYSVAQHSVLVSRYCDPADALWGLLHDAAEAYLIDVARPVKRSSEFGFYRQAEDRIRATVAERFRLWPSLIPSSVHRADNRMLMTEARDLMAPLAGDWGYLGDPYPDEVQPWTPGTAEAEFLNRFNQLAGDR